MLRFRMIATRSACRMRSISELKAREYVQGQEVGQNVIQLTAAYLTSQVLLTIRILWLLMQVIGSSLQKLLQQLIASSMCTGCSREDASG